MEHITCYSSDSEEEEQEQKESNKQKVTEHSSTTTKSKHSLPPVPEYITDRFAKRPKLPHPEFYDRPNYNKEPMVLFPGLYPHFVSIHVGVSRSQCLILDPLIAETKAYLRLHGFGEFVENIRPLYMSSLLIPEPLHVSLGGTTYLDSKQAVLFDQELKKRIPNIINNKEFSNKLTFDRLEAYPNYIGTDIFFALGLSEVSRRSVGKLLNLVTDLKHELVTDKEIGPGFKYVPETLHCSIASSVIPLKYGTWNSKLQRELRDCLQHIEIDPRIEFDFSHLKVSKERQNIPYSLISTSKPSS